MNNEMYKKHYKRNPLNWFEFEVINETFDNFQLQKFYNSYFQKSIFWSEEHNIFVFYFQQFWCNGELDYEEDLRTREEVIEVIRKSIP